MVQSTTEPSDSRCPTQRIGFSFAVATGVFLLAGSVRAQSPVVEVPGEETRAASIAKSLAGGALGLVMHETGHLLFDITLGAGVGIRAVRGAGIPFFAITHRTVSPLREFVIASAGFWVQHATNELVLTQRPQLRHEHAPVLKGILAFNVLTSAIYSGAAFSRSGPVERDTRSMAEFAGIREQWVGALILAPAALDLVRYFRPESRTLKWASRAAKIGGVLLIVKAGG